MWLLVIIGCMLVLILYPLFSNVHCVWNCIYIPKHGFILWLVLHQRFLTCDRLQSWSSVPIDRDCVLCKNAEESHQHLFFRCAYSRQVVRKVQRMFGLTCLPLGLNEWRRWVQHLRHSRIVQVTTWYVVVAGLVYGV